jgi:hypothetical protein
MGTGVGEAMLISAATGGGMAAVTGGDPLKGALLGAVTGGVGHGIAGAGAAGGATGSYCGNKYRVGAGFKLPEQIAAQFSVYCTKILGMAGQSFYQGANIDPQYGTKLCAKCWC